MKNENGFIFEQHLDDCSVQAGYIRYTLTFTIKGNWDLPFTRLLNKCIKFDFSDQISRLLKGCFDEVSVEN